MRLFGILSVLAATLATSVVASFAQTTPANPLEFSCIGTTSTACANGDASLRDYNTAGTKYVAVSGYFAPGDGGAGTFYNLGASSGVCKSQSLSGSSSVGSTTIALTGSPILTSLRPGELVSVTGTNIQSVPGAQIASIVNLTSISLTVPLTGTASGSLGVSVTVTGDNGGTLIIDKAGDCFQKADYRGDPHEWGAYGDGALTVSPSPHDDTVAIENWLGAYGNAVNVPGTTGPSNFGPWRPTIPGTYLVSQPLICPPNATIQGDVNETNNGSTGTPNPRVNFLASPTFSGYTAYTKGSGFFGMQGVIQANAFCRLSGIGVTGNNNFIPFSNISTGGTTIALPNVSNLQLGNSVYVIDNSGTAQKIDGTVITSISPSSTCTPTPCVTVSQSLSTLSSQNVFFFGPDAVDLLDGANTVTIDGFTVLQNGRYGIFCGINADNSHAVTQLRVQNTHFQTAMQHGMYFPNNCDNLRLMDNNVSQAGSMATTVGSPAAPAIGGDGIYLGTSEASIEGGIIQDAAGAGIRLAGASQVSISGVAITENGSNNVGGDAGAGIAIDHSTFSATICNNHISGNGGVENTASAQIYFSGTNNIDNINLCGNIYTVTTPTKRKSNASIAPLYVYNADAASALTNIHIYESPEQPGASIFSPTAQPLLQASATPQFTTNQINGLILSNDSPTSQVLDITAGSAADSTNSTLITLPAPATGTIACSVNFNSGTANGLGGLDSGTVAKNQTYFIFLVSPARGKGSPGCMASTSPVPAFTASSFGSTGYQGSLTGGTLASASASKIVYNVNPQSSGFSSPINGIMAGDAVWGSAVATGSTITGFSANTEPSTQPTATANTGDVLTINCGGSCTSLSIYEGMAIQDDDKCLPGGTYITDTSALGSSKITVSGFSTTKCPSGITSSDQLGISGAQQVVLSANTTALSDAASITVATAYYRLIGAVYTDGSTPPDVVNFNQNGDTYYLNTPVHDIHKTSLGTTTQTAVLNGVPSGVSVEALGRCAGGPNLVILYPGTIPAPAAAAAPSSFSAAPGYAVTSTGPDSAFNFRLYTDTSAKIMAQASAGSTTLDCMTDGWVFHR